MKRIFISIIAIMALIVLLSGCDTDNSTNSDMPEILEIGYIPTESTAPKPDEPDEHIDPSEGFGIGGGFDVGTHRPLFYDMPRHFIDLVERSDFFEWDASRSWEERENIHVAVGFIQHFNISREDFTRANEEWEQSIIDRGDTPNRFSHLELYPVDLIFTFDNEAINDFFRWENSPWAYVVGIGEPPTIYGLPYELTLALGGETSDISPLNAADPFIVRAGSFLLDVIAENHSDFISPTREGYIFMGWYFYHHNERLPVTERTRMPAHDNTIHAHWERVETTSPPQIQTTSPIPHAYFNHPYTLTLQATGNTPITWSIVGLPYLDPMQMNLDILDMNETSYSIFGHLPEGLVLCPTTGTISGTPIVSPWMVSTTTRPGTNPIARSFTFMFEVRADNAFGYSIRTLSITVLAQSPIGIPDPYPPISDDPMR